MGGTENHLGVEKGKREKDRSQAEEKRQKKETRSC